MDEWLESIIRFISLIRRIVSFHAQRGMKIRTLRVPSA